MREAIEAAEALLRKNPYAIIAIDGNCASGKTTLSSEFKRRDIFIPAIMPDAADSI